MKVSTPREFRYRQVDVFTDRPLEGNALAVFPDAAGLDADTMQRVARELNLAETAFVLPPTRPDCTHRVRIFTPAKEMQFAGHPTIGTGFVLLDEGLVDPQGGLFALEEAIGAVSVRVERDPDWMLWLRTPRIRQESQYDASLCAQVLGLDPADLLRIPPQRLSAGNPTLFVGVRDCATVDRAWMDLSGMKRLRGQNPEPFCVFVFTPTERGAYSRMFAPEYGIPEDPATGSSTGPLALYMMRHGLLRTSAGGRFVSEQGARMGRRSLVHIRINGENGIDGIEVGGRVTPVGAGVMRLPFRHLD